MGRIASRPGEWSDPSSRLVPRRAAFVFRQARPSVLVYNPSGHLVDVWVADGYGLHVVHRFDAAGRLLATLDGTAAAAAGNLYLVGWRRGGRIVRLERLE
jgi:hypothetical protein